MTRATHLIAIVLGVSALGGCVPLPPTAPHPDEISHSPAAPSASTTSKPQSTETPAEPEPNEFTREELVELCVADALDPSRVSSRTVHVEQARVERRTVAPPWFVYVPMTDSDPSLAFHDMAFLCVYGGTPENVERTMYGTFRAQTDEQIATWINSNELIGAE